MHNYFVNVYSVQVEPKDTVLLHKHDVDSVGVMLGDAVITVRAPGKPDSHLKVVGGQLRLQRFGYIHSTFIDGDTAYRNVTVELLLPQQERRNICATVISGQPLNCPSALSDSAAFSEQPQFETDQTKINLIRLKPQQGVTLDTSAQSQLLVVLDDTVTVTGVNNPPKALRTGDIFWRDSNSAAQIFENAGSKEIRLVTFVFKNEKSAK
jgi:quercetin dioxygenase-like cupin family protein